MFFQLVCSSGEEEQGWGLTALLEDPLRMGWTLQFIREGRGALASTEGKGAWWDPRSGPDPPVPPYSQIHQRHKGELKSLAEVAGPVGDWLLLRKTRARKT